MATCGPSTSVSSSASARIGLFGSSPRARAARRRCNAASTIAGKFGFFFVRSAIPRAKVYLRSLLYSTSKRGRIVENMFVRLRRLESSQTFNIWAHGEDSLTRGSGLYVGETGVLCNHHFLLPTGETAFAFLPGDYILAVYVSLVGDTKPLLLFIPLSTEHFLYPAAGHQCKRGARRMTAGWCWRRSPWRATASSRASLGANGAVTSGWALEGQRCAAGGRSGEEGGQPTRWMPAGTWTRGPGWSPAGYSPKTLRWDGPAPTA